MKARLICIGLLFLSASCSKHTRISDPQISAQEMLKNLSDAQNSTEDQVSATVAAQAWAMKDDPHTTVYYGDAPSPMGTVRSLLAFKNLSFVNGKNLASGGIRQVRVFFLDNPSAAGGRQDALLIGISTATDQGQFKYYGFSGKGEVSGKRFEAKLSGAGEPIVVRSFDVDGGNLAPTIQLRVYSTGAGGENYLGKFSVLAGFQ